MSDVIDRVETPSFRRPIDMPEPITPVPGDGSTRIVVGGGGLTDLGRWLDMRYANPYNHPRLGEFECILGQWYWQVTGGKHDAFRKAFGPEVMELARRWPLQYSSHHSRAANFRQGVITMIKSKIPLRRAFMANRLPLAFLNSTMDGQYRLPLDEGFQWADPGSQYIEMLNNLRLYGWY
jgi:hypothetical protein